MYASPAAAEERPLLSGSTLRGVRSGSFVRLKSHHSASEFGALEEEESPGSDGLGRGPRGGWHRCNAHVGPPPAFVSHFALGAGTLTQGYDQTSLGFLLATGYGGYVPLSSWQQGLVVSIFFFGGIGGAYVSASLNDRWGRRSPLLFAAALVTVTALLGTTTTSYAWLLCVRTAYGFASGMNNASLAIYLAEITPKRQRGGVVAMTELLFAIGGVLACGVQLLLQRLWSSPVGQANGWRLLVGTEALFGCVMLLGSLQAVESPRWLLQKGRDWEAERVLLRIHAPERRQDGTCSCAERNSELAEAVESLRAQLDADDGSRDTAQHAPTTSGTLALLASPEQRVRRALEISVAMALVPLIGIGCIPQQFVPLVLGTVGARRRDTGAIALETVLIDLTCNAIYTVGAAAQCFFLVDKVGRRWPLILSLLGAAVGFALDAQALSPVRPGEDAPRRHAGTALAGVALGYACRALGVGPLPQVVGAEVIPLSILTRGKAVSTMLRRCCAMVYCLLLPPALQRLGGRCVFRSQGVCSALFAAFVWLRLPETRGFEISEIESILHTVEWVPFEPAPPPPSDADTQREAAARARAREAGALVDGPAAELHGRRVKEAQEGFTDWDEWDIWGGRGAYRT